MATLATIGTVLTVGSAVIGAGAAVYGAYNSYQAGVAAQAEYERQAGVDELSGKMEFAASQREAELRRLEGGLIMSRQQAYAAASGAGSGVDDPTILKIMSDTGANADMNARSVMSQGEARRDDYLNAAKAKRASGSSNFLGGILRATGALADGVGNLAATSRDWIPAAQSLARG